MSLSLPASRLLQLASDATLCGYGPDLVSAELAEVVPHLHPDDALMRFEGLRQSNDALTKVLAWSTSDSETLRSAAVAAAEYQQGLVDKRLADMFTPTTAFKDDGSQWSADDTRRLVGVEVRAVAA